MRMLSLVGSALIIAGVSALPAQACDICAIYSGISAVETKKGELHLGISEQFTEFREIQTDGRKVENSAHQRLASSITQLYASYDVDDRLSLQLVLPYMHRQFRTVHSDGTERGTEAGLGDVSLLAKYLIFNSESTSSIARVALLAGIKMPSGDSDRLAAHTHAEEHTEPVDERSETAHAMHALAIVQKHAIDEHHEEPVASAIHGHDLALGTGSLDFPLGVNALVQRGRWMLTTGAQYILRGEGRDEYQFANDLTYYIAPSYFIALDDEFTVAAGVQLSGEWKEKDTGRAGALEQDTAIRSLFVGPTISVSMGDGLCAELAYDLPADIENSGTQAVPDYRIRAALHMRF